MRCLKRQYLKCLLGNISQTKSLWPTHPGMNVILSFKLILWNWRLGVARPRELEVYINWIGDWTLRFIGRSSCQLDQLSVNFLSIFYIVYIPGYFQVSIATPKNAIIEDEYLSGIIDRDDCAAGCIIMNKHSLSCFVWAVALRIRIGST